VSKRTVGLIAALALVLGGAAGFAWHAPGRPSTWTDVRTWAGFGIVIIGAGIALTQMDMQRRQLRSQQRVLEGEVERNKRRDALLDGQLRELEQRARTLDRQQAEAVDLKLSSNAEKVPGSEPPSQHRVHVAEVANNSRRPIRDVSCRIEPEPGDGPYGSRRTGVYALSEMPASRVRIGLSDGTHIPLLRADVAGAFVFAVDTKEHPIPRTTLRFTDDAGLHWQINHDLHLEQLPGRDW
jgi:uncharacterized membrane protein